MEAAKGNRHGHRDATMILLTFGTGCGRAMCHVMDNAPAERPRSAQPRPCAHRGDPRPYNAPAGGRASDRATSRSSAGKLWTLVTCGGGLIRTDQRAT
jgi:hypothetical protein